MSARNKKILLVVSLLGLLAAGAVGLFFWTHEKVEREVRQAPSGEVRRNPYLALERLLGRFGHNTQTLRKLSAPDDTLTTIILADQNYDFSPEQVDTWAQWVREGGHLVLSQPYVDADEKTAPLLGRLGFSPEQGSWRDNIESISVSVGEDAGEGADLSWRAADADWLARYGEDKVIAASRLHEAGRVTLIADTSIFSNDLIGKGEHATLAVRMAELRRGYEVEWPNITIVLYGKRQSWMFYVLGHTWPFVVIVLVALLLAIRAGRNRFGPVLADPPPERRSRREHIEAVGRFLWQQGSIASLVEAAQRALMDELEHRRPALAHVALTDRDEIIAEELGISSNEARELFRKPSGNKNAQSFTEQIRILEQHRRRL